MWQTTDQTSRLTADSWQAEVGLDQLRTGVTFLDRDGRRQRCLGIQLRDVPQSLSDETVVDHYVRQNDLVVTYAYRQPQEMRLQVYWRYQCVNVAGTRVHGIQLVVSLQTDRLDSHPTIVVTSRLTADRALQLGATDVEPPIDQPETIGHAKSLFLFGGHADTTVLMAYPNDVVGATMNGPENAVWTCEYELVNEHLEKGVIRRAQLAAWVVPRDSETSTARSLFEQFLASPPPLTV